MKTHRRSWMLRAGVVASLAAGALIGVSAPAMAAVLDVKVDQPGDFHPGDTKQVGVHATGTGAGQVQVNGLTGDFDIRLIAASQPCTNRQPTTTCTFEFGNDGREDLTFIVSAHQNVSVAPGQSVGIHMTVNAGPANDAADFKLFGPTAAPTTAPAVQTVNEVSGVVKDGTNGNPIKNAVVALQDSQAHNYTFTTGTNGAFTFKGTADKPITPGVVAVGVQVDGYTTMVKNTPSLTPGQTYKFPQAFGMAPTAATPSVAPTTADPAAGAPAPSDTGSAASQANLNPAAKTGSTGSFSTILIALGALLILLGVGAVVYILVRRRKDTDDDGVDDGPGRAPVPAGVGRAGYADDATAVARSGGYGQPTMATTRDPLADAPTMLQGRPPLDEYPDPYAAPPPAAPRPGGYGDATQQYGGSPYGGGGGRYDEPTSYDDRRGYREPGNVYGEPEPPRYADHGGYEEPARGGGYGGGGYEPRRASEYAEPRDPYGAGYESGHARHGTPSAPDSRRQLDWLDD